MKEDNVFISYSHKDQKEVEHIIELIKSRTDKEIWYDGRLIGGENYFSVIAEQIIKCSFFIFVVSNYSVNSDFCLRELEFAASERKNIIAIWLDNISISPRVKLVIQNTHYVNYYSSTENKFATDIEKSFSRASVNTRTKDSQDVVQEREWNDKKYFLSKEITLKIERLLEKERQGKYSFCFDVGNAVLLGLAYEMGVATDADIEKAKFYYRISEYGGSVDGEYLLGVLMLQDAFDSEKLNLHRISAAEKNSVYALIDLGDDYYEGKNGCEVDLSKAYELYKRAAIQGNPQAMYYMAYGHRNGEGVSVDYPIALMYALKSMEQGFPRAFRILAFMYENGDYFKQDYLKAVDYFERAIKKGDYLSLCYEGFVQGQLGNIEKKKELYTQAVKYADDNLTRSGLPYLRMAYLYEEGEGVNQDYIIASQFYLKGAERNNISSKKYAVSCIRNITNEEIRKDYLIKALALGCENAGYFLGESEEKTKDERLSDDAVEYYTKGAELGDMDCVLSLLWDYSFVLGKGKDRNDRLQAIRWFQFLFANADQEFMERLRKNDLLSTYYYAYAIELDYDPGTNMPDRKFVQLYFTKSLEQSFVHYKRILSFAVDGYLFPEKSASDLNIDVEHAQEILTMLIGQFKDYYAYAHEKNDKELLDEWKNVLELFRNGYKKLHLCYAKGISIEKDRKKAAKYNKMEKVFIIMIEIQNSGKLTESDISLINI